MLSVHDNTIEYNSVTYMIQPEINAEIATIVVDKHHCVWYYKDNEERLLEMDSPSRSQDTASLSGELINE